MKSDIEIAQSSTLSAISTIAEKINLQPEDFYPFGHHIAKLTPDCLRNLQKKSNGKLILVTAISPTPAGEGKTTTTIGLADALNLALKETQKNAMVCIREPSLGPVFGLKGGATGGGFSQVLPMEDINLHFTGDFHAITSANNLLAALIDNHIYHGNALNIDTSSISWRRCMDMNDRALRRVSLDTTNKETGNQLSEKSARATGFDITVASEVMAIFCLADSLEDLKTRLGKIQIGVNLNQAPVFAKDLQAEGAMTALLKNAFQPNLVQTIGGTPALVHGGPFANIAHGCNSVIATKIALKLADYVVTEAGFGADLGAEKFIDIKCRQSGLHPDAVVIVATIRALKYHGGVDVKDLNTENIAALEKGMANINKHLDNLTQHFGLNVVVAINHFYSDTQKEIDFLLQAIEQLGVKAVLCQHWEKGGEGALTLAENILDMVNDTKKHKTPHFLYDAHLTIPEKIFTIASKMYGAKEVIFSEAAQKKLAFFEQFSAQFAINHFSVCIAKTQYSFSSDPQLRGAPQGHVLQVRELRLAHGAGFVVAICGDVMTMPGLPVHPASEHIDVDADGNLIGLS